jgi:hypothetical protein
MEPNAAPRSQRTRRQFFADCGVGAGKIALASLLVDRLGAQGSARLPDGCHFAPRVRSVIYLFMAGAPSQLELFDHKPELARWEGKQVPPELVADARYAFIRKDAALLGPRFAFARHGDSGAELSQALPFLAQVADRIAIVRSMHTDQFNHAPAQIFLNTGSPRPGRPAMGAWVAYGLGSPAQDLPAFVVLSSGGGTSGGSANWSSGFLPSEVAGVPFLRKGDPIPDLSNPPGCDRELQRESIELIAALNRAQHERVQDPAILARVSTYELAFRMQARAPELTDLSGEPQHVLDLYGADPGEPSFARNCLMARRLVERGVRFVQLYHEAWDHHTDVEGGVRAQTKLTDQASAALVLDLAQRGLLDDTLVVWGGEFGRTPMVESHAALGRKNGRDHHPHAFSMWLAGGGVRAGTTLGATDELGFNVVEDPVHVHDLQATILHLLGLDHEKLTFHHQGRDFRLTDVHGRVVRKLLA